MRSGRFPPGEHSDGIPADFHIRAGVALMTWVFKCLAMVRGFYYIHTEERSRTVQKCLKATYIKIKSKLGSTLCSKKIMAGEVNPGKL